MSEKQEQAGKGDKNVSGGLLAFFQKGEGFQKGGYCHSDNSDPKNFSVAATLTHAFLQSEYGDDPPYKGHKAGQKMCISAYHFAQAIKEMGPDTGPKVHLQATSERALEVVSYDTLRNFATKS